MEPLPENIDTAFELHQAGRIADALAIYEKLLLRQPSDAGVMYLLGTANLQMRRFDEAVGQLDQAIALNKGNAPAYCNRGVALKNLGRLEEALASYDQALALDPASAMAWKNRGSVLYAAQAV